MRLEKRLSTNDNSLSDSDDDVAVIKGFDVVIVGNGPSAIILSYFLSGHWPYYNGKPVDDPILKERLSYVSQTKSLVLQDLEWLSEGLYDSRTMNPVSILFDRLFHPNADMLTNDDAVIEWRYDPNNEVRHVVLGLGPAGGSWHHMTNSQLSVSLAQWLELPGYSFKEWYADHVCTLDHLPKISHTYAVHPDRTNTLYVGLYYAEYVKQQNLCQNFKNNVKVTSVIECTNNGTRQWKVSGTECLNDHTSQPFVVYTDNVALATGASCVPRKLGVSGEHFSFVNHSMPDFIRYQKCPVLVVGCGLVALDTILQLMSQKIPVYHVFRRSATDPEVILNQLSNAYADYLKLKPLMMGKGPVNELYTPIPEHVVKEILQNHDVIVEHVTKMISYKIHVSRVIVHIGLIPDLSILDDPDSLKEEPDAEFNIKTNPLDIDLYTYEARTRSGLYALGPLVGDNFVRLISGGALAITHGLFRNEVNDFSE